MEHQKETLAAGQTHEGAYQNQQDNYSTRSHAYLVFRLVNSLTHIGYNGSPSIGKNRFPLCPSQQPHLI